KIASEISDKPETLHDTFPILKTTFLLFPDLNMLKDFHFHVTKMLDETQNENPFCPVVLDRRPSL
ncbi:hypothetical protein P7K49_005637, partial [Saguinus oedipus]